jgi:2-polyprenyl-6-methoxyphenol hydroxylase-like FAD-dependent oxidoreductase
MPRRTRPFPIDITTDFLAQVGAGPVGLLVALRLAKAGIPTTILEMLPHVEQSPRAAVYHAVSVRELDRAGVLEDCRKRGSTGSDVCWRKVNGEIIAEIDRRPEPGEYEVLVLGQHILAEIILSHVERTNSKILFNRKVNGLKQDDTGVDLEVETPSGTEIMRARYVVGSDGGKSSIRRLADISFEGFTYPENLVACNVIYPFEKYGFQGGNFIVDKEHWCLVAKLAEHGMWRCSYGELPNLTHEELLARQPMKFESIFPGPRPLEYELKMVAPYRINQRCAGSFRKGRILLAGDAVSSP